MDVLYTLTTLEPVIVSQNTATTTNHLGLDYIPGSAVLGMVANTLYPLVGETMSWSLFHSGEVQFSPCYPVIDDELCLPTPASWHYQKMAKPTRKLPSEDDAQFEQYDHNQVTNQASLNFERQKGVQYKQCRNGFVSSTGKLGKVQQGLVTKTALDRESGAVKEGSLFSYTYIEAGQRFAGRIKCHTQEQYNLVKAHLLGIKRIGRSRSAEFGKVEIVESEQGFSVPSITTQHGTVVVWCLSDSQLLNDNGLPIFTPSLADLIPGACGSLNKQHSFIRTSTVSRFNQARQGLDSEQLLIAKGSVLVFDNVDVEPGQLAMLASEGMGINRQQGLGWVAVNPTWSSHEQLPLDAFFEKVKVGSVTDEKDADEALFSSGDIEHTPLTLWVESKLEQANKRNESEKDIAGILRHIIYAYQAFRSYNHIVPSYAIGPSSTQWGRVRESLRTKPDNWMDILFKGKDDKTSTAVCKSVNDEQGWGISWQQGDSFIDFSECCKQLFARHSINEVFAAAERLGRYDLSIYAECQRAKKDLLNEEGTRDE